VKNKLAFVIAVVLGFIAIWGVYEYIQKQSAKYEKKYRPVRIAVANEHVKAGTVVEMKMIDPDGKEVTEDSITQDHVLNRDKFILAGKTINRDVERGEPLLKSYFRKPVVRLERTIQHGERAITLKVDNITGVAGNVVPGSHIDLWGTFDVAPGGAGGQAGKEGVTVLLLSNVTVLAVDNRTQAGQYSLARGMRDAYGSVTLAVTPEEAGMLVYAQSVGLITLALRSPSDSGTPTMPENFAMQNLISRAAEAEKARKKRLEKRSVIIIDNNR